MEEMLGQLEVVEVFVPMNVDPPKLIEIIRILQDTRVKLIFTGITDTQLAQVFNNEILFKINEQMLIPEHEAWNFLTSYRDMLMNQFAQPSPQNPETEEPQVDIGDIGQVNEMQIQQMENMDFGGV